MFRNDLQDAFFLPAPIIPLGVIPKEYSGMGRYYSGIESFLKEIRFGSRTIPDYILIVRIL